MFANYAWTSPIARSGHAEEIGGRTVQQDAATFRTRAAVNSHYLVAAIADGVGSAKGSEYIARAAVEAVCALGEAADFGDCPDELLTMAAAVLPLYTATAHAEAGNAFAGFADGPGYGYRPDATVAVVTINREDAAIAAAWLGDCRVWVELAEGRLIQLTEDHNMARIGRPNVITRSLANPGEGRQRAEWHWHGRAALRPVRVLLTTDGVHEVLSARAIHHAMTTAPNPQRAAIWLTRWAVRAAGRDADNASALLFEIIAPAEPAEESPAEPASAEVPDELREWL
ncbi:PP2C family protein-serine/threonine phosphatase [Nocardia sp. NPDC055029]